MARAVDAAAGALRADILARRLPSGTRLGEADLAERLAVSRTPVREALTRLAAEGLVELTPHRGARVATWTAEQLRDIFDLRLAVEPAVVALAVERQQDDAASALDHQDELAERMVRAGRPGAGQDLDGVAALNAEFHDGWVRLAANAAYAAALRTVVHAAVVRRNFADYDPAALARSLEHHREMVTAARAGEPEWAAAVMRAHLHAARWTMLRPAGP